MCGTGKLFSMALKVEAVYAFTVWTAGQALGFPIASAAGGLRKNVLDKGITRKSYRASRDHYHKHAQRQLFGRTLVSGLSAERARWKAWIQWVSAIIGIRRKYARRVVEPVDYERSNSSRSLGGVCD